MAPEESAEPPGWTAPPPEPVDRKLESVGDHAMGVELQLEELVEQRKRALVQNRQGDADAILAQINQLQDELAETIGRLE